MTEYLEIALRGRRSASEYRYLSDGPDGPGVYKVDVTLSYLPTDEAVRRLQELLAKTEEALEQNLDRQMVENMNTTMPPEECQEARVIGCAEAGPHSSHMIWEENTADIPRYIWALCSGSDE